MCATIRAQRPVRAWRAALFFTTGVRPFGETETMRGMRRRLWRDPVPPRRLPADYPPWLQEIVLRCLEIAPAWRYPTAAQLAFDLRHPDEVKLTARSERLKQDPLSTALRRRFNPELTQPRRAPTVANHLALAPIVAVAVDLDGDTVINDDLRTMAGRILATLPSARLACVNVLKLGRITLDTTLDEHGHNKHVDRLVALRHWAEPLKLDDSRLTVHVLEAFDPATAILAFAQASHVSHILIGARQSSRRRKLLGSVSAEVAAKANCAVTVVRPVATGGTENQSPAGDDTDETSVQFFRGHDPADGSCDTASANFRIRRTSSSISRVSHVAKMPRADPLARGIDQGGHRLAFRGDKRFTHPAIGGAAPALHQIEIFELGDLAADGGVIPAPHGPPDRRLRSDRTARSGPAEETARDRAECPPP